MLGQPRALLLDLDGTLVDRDAALRAWLRRRAGLNVREADEALGIDVADHHMLAELALWLHERRPGLARDPLALAQRMRSELPDEIRPDPAIDRALARLRAGGLRLALLSNGGPGQRAKLAAAKLDPARFAAVVISSEVGLAKPDARIFALALAKLGVPGEQVAMVGDSPELDVAGAHAAGLRSVWLAHGRAWPRSIAPPSASVEHFPALPALLGM
jgi:putative hydrolase of the HAD superfamily